MRALWTIARILIALLALATTLLASLFVTGPKSGTSVDPNGALIDAVALVVLVAVAWSLWRDRGRLF